MLILRPTPVTDTILTSSTIAEPATGEIAWVSSGSYAVGDRRIRATTHKVYECVAAHSGRTEYPENDSSYWIEYSPTAKWAMFDNYVSTASSASNTLTVVLAPGMFNAVALYGLDAGSLSITIKDTPGGSIVYSSTEDLQEPPLDWWDWAFGPIRQLTKVVKTDLTPYLNAELTVSLISASGTVKVGMLVVGDCLSLLGYESIGGSQYGASAEPVDYSYIKTDDFGNTQIVKRHSATNLQVKVWVPKIDADYALSIIQSVLAVPCACIATPVPGYQGLNSFGLVSGSMSYESCEHAMLDINVKGLV